MKIGSGVKARQDLETRRYSSPYYFQTLPSLRGLTVRKLCTKACRLVRFCASKPELENVLPQELFIKNHTFLYIF